MNRALVLVSALVLALALSACGSDGGDSNGEPAPQPAEDSRSGASPTAAGAPSEGAAPGDGGVLVQGFRYQPAGIEVPAGTTVTWSNEDQINHTVTAGTPEAPEDAFDLELAGAGTAASHTFDEPGTYVYFCKVHESMRGEVVVSE